MPGNLRPKTRPIGQVVVTVNDCRQGRFVIPKGSTCRVEGVNIGSDNRVSYKLIYRDRLLVWVKPTDIKKAE